MNMNKDKLIEFAKDQCEIFPEDSYMGKYLRETLKMLQVEPCEDTVSRQAALDMATTIQTDDYSGNEILEVIDVDDIKSLPPVKPTQNWIPVGERLPKERIAVLVYCPERKNIYCACYEEKQWWIFGAYFEKIEEDVIAWMPMPKPYKTETESEV